VCVCACVCVCVSDAVRVYLFSKVSALIRNVNVLYKVAVRMQYWFTGLLVYYVDVSFEDRLLKL